MTKTVAIEETALDEIFGDLHSNDEVVVTRDGQPIAKVTGIDSHPRRFRTLEELRKSGRVVGDILEPLDEEWDVEK
jgi:hypothetical protein